MADNGPHVAKPVKSYPDSTNVSPISLALLLAYKTLATLVTFAIPVIFILGGVSLIEPRDFANWLGIVVAITTGFLWASLPMVQVLVGYPPQDATDAELEEFHQATIPGTFVKCLAFVVGFAVPILFVSAAFEPFGWDEEYLKPAAIVCAIVAAALYVSSKSLDDFVREGRV